MSQSLAQVLIHVIFSTKQRYPYLNPDVRPELHAYLATVLQALKCPAILINSLEDHVHILCRLSRRHAICDLVQEIKTNTSKWLKTKGGLLAGFHWQNGYGVFSVSPSNALAVRRYIEDQETHHREVTFQEEYRAFLARHGIEYDERYVWD